MKNNAMHYKMYKAKKNIVFAGLATTAALAGLTFANVNNTANADTVAEPAVAATSAATASAATTSNASDSAAIQQAQSDVASTSANVQSQTAVVNSASNALASAQQINSASTAVSDAEVAYNSANSAYWAANQQVGSAATVSQKASAAASDAQAWADWWNATGEKNYNDITTKLNSQEAALSDAQAQLPTLTDQWNAASDAYDSVMSDSNASSDQKSAATIAKETAYNNLMSARDIIKNNKVKYYQNALNGKAPYGSDNAKVDYVYAKSQVDALASLKNAASVAHQNYLNAIAARKAAGDVANAKFEAWTAAREAYNLPNADELAKLQREAAGANNKIKEDQAAIKYNVKKDGVSYNDAQTYASDATVKQGKAQAAVNSAQAALDSANQQLSDFQKKLDAAQSAYDQNSNDLNKALLDHAKQAVNAWTNVVNKNQNALKAEQANLDHQNEQVSYWTNFVKELEATPDYIKLSNDITYRQGIVDRYNQAKANLAAAKDAAAAVAPLQAKYDAAVQLLNAYTEQYNQAKAKLDALLNGQKPDNPGSDNPGSSSTPDSSANPGSSSTPDSSSTPGSSSTPDSSATPGSSSTPDSNVTSDSTSNSDVNNGSNNGSAVNPGANNGNSAVNGGATANNGSAVNPGANNGNSVVNGGATANNGSVAGNTTAVDLGNNTQAVLPAASANASAKSEAASDASAASLPQTGNENAGAIVALGAVSAMFGLGLAAKKREF